MLAFFGVGDFGGEGGEAGGVEFIADGVTGEAQGAGVDHQDPADALPEQRGKVTQQAAPDDHAVVVAGTFAGDVDDC